MEIDNSGSRGAGLLQKMGFFLAKVSRAVCGLARVCLGAVLALLLQLWEGCWSICCAQSLLPAQFHTDLKGFRVPF